MEAEHNPPWIIDSFTEHETRRELMKRVPLMTIEEFKARKTVIHLGAAQRAHNLFARQKVEGPDMSSLSFGHDLPAPRKQIEILVVESNPADVRLTELAFKSAGLTSGFRTVSDGEDALAYVHKKGNYVNVATPDLIFLDLSLPRVSGLDVLKAIKSTPHLMHIPIVVASGSDDPEHIRAVYALNGNCFMRKPDSLTQFLKFVETCYEFWGSVVTLSPTDSRPHA
jgi:two-component system, chemotaxis family, response regulator Rcp1